MCTLLKLQGDPTCEPGVNLIIRISESRGEFPVFDRLVRENVMHLFGRLASVAEITTCNEYTYLNANPC